MTPMTSSWIPQSRIRVAVGLALGLAVLGVAGGLWWRGALVLLVPALGAGWAALVMLRIRDQLSARGGGWERPIHEAVAASLDLAPTSQASTTSAGSSKEMARCSPPTRT